MMVVAARKRSRIALCASILGMVALLGRAGAAAPVADGELSTPVPAAQPSYLDASGSEGFSLIPKDMFASPATEYVPHNGFWFESRPTFWFAGISGTVKAGNRSANVDVPFDKIFKNTDFATAMRFDIGYDKLFVLFDGMYFNLGKDNTGPRGNQLDLTIKMAIIEADLGYRLLDTPLGSGTPANAVGPRLTADALAGVRWTYLQADLDLKGLGTRGREKYWADPIVGGRARVAFTDTIGFEVKADIGGFDVGSQLDWNVQGQFEYQLFRKINLVAGYRWLNYKYKPGDVDFDVQINGPYIGAITTW
jgi:hypothetical protein